MVKHNKINSSRIAVGIQDAVGKATIRWNDFGGQYAGSNFSWDRPFNIFFDQLGSGGNTVDATNNWWATTSPTEIARTIDAQGATPSTWVNYTSPWSSYHANP